MPRGMLGRDRNENAVKNYSCMLWLLGSKRCVYLHAWRPAHIDWFATLRAGLFDGWALIRRSYDWMPV